MLQQGVIRESDSSPWSLPVQLVSKKDGTTRFCVEYRLLNSKVVFHTFSLLLIAELAKNLLDAKIFSTLDLESGYWQLPLTEESKACTGFSTLNGHYEFHVLPCWISVAPALFQSTKSRLFKGLKFVGVYMDDIVVFLSNEEESVRRPGSRSVREDRGNKKEAGSHVQN
jgi:putative transposase